MINVKILYNITVGIRETQETPSNKAFSRTINNHSITLLYRKSFISAAMFFNVVLCFCLVVFGNCQTMLDTHNLLTNLMKDYDKLVRPAVDQSQPVHINVSFNLVAIQEFDEVSEKLSVVGVLNLVWTDERLKWNPADYNNSWTVNIPFTDVWAPQLILTNPINKIKKLGQDWEMIKFVFNGQGYVSVGDVIHSKCNVDVTYFPYDTQNCEIMFIPWGLTAYEVIMVSTLDHALLDYFSENGEWTLVETSAVSGYVETGDFSFITFGIKIKRRPTFFLVNVVLPIIFMGFLNVLVFVLPVQSGERVSYAITVLLAIAVFLTLVGDNMPKTSEPMSTLCYFLIVNLILSSAICFGSIVSLMLYYRNDSGQPPSPAMASLTRILLCKKRKDVTDIKILSKAKDTVSHTNMNMQETILPQNNFFRLMDDGSTKDTDITWKDVSRAADRVFGFTSLVWLIVTSATFMVMIATQNSMTPSG